MKIELDKEEDGRWIAVIPELPGVMVYGTTREEAIKKVETLALRVIADRIDHGEIIPEIKTLFALLECLYYPYVLRKFFRNASHT